LVHAREPLVHAREPLVHAREPLVHAREPLVHAREPLVHAREPLVHAREPLVHAREPLVHAREPLVHAWEPLVHAPERRVHAPLRFLPQRAGWPVLAGGASDLKEEYTKRFPTLCAGRRLCVRRAMQMDDFICQGMAVRSRLADSLRALGRRRRPFAAPARGPRAPD